MVGVSRGVPACGAGAVLPSQPPMGLGANVSTARGWRSAGPRVSADTERFVRLALVADGLLLRLLLMRS